MKFKYLEIGSQYHSFLTDDKKPPEGKVMFVGQTGVISINVTPDLADRILKICAEELVKCSQIIANNMTAEIITSSAITAIEDKTNV